MQSWKGVRLISNLNSASTPRELQAIDVSSFETSLTLASAHALVLLEDGLVGDPMEKTTLEAMKWKLGKGDIVSPMPVEGINGSSNTASKAPQIAIKRRFQFSSALKRMSTVSVVSGPTTQKRTFVAVKGAPETLKKMYTKLPENYESTYKWFAQRGSRVLALGYKFVDASSDSQVCLETTLHSSAWSDNRSTSDKQASARRR